ncbi:unnamed protein product, partial [Heterotrigona itama]
LSALMFCKQALNTGLWIDVKYAQLSMLLHLNKHWTLRRIGNELISTALIIFFNNSCISDNAIPIKSWFSDAGDTALLSLLPVLDALRFTQDVRSVLSRNLHLHHTW